MKKRVRFGIGCLATVLWLAGCRHALPPEVAQHFQGRSLFTCCNLHYEADEISDANYWVGKTLPAGTPVLVEQVTDDGVRFGAGEVELKLVHRYGTGQESLQQYVDKVLLANDPRPRMAAYSPAVRHAIDSSKVEQGMMREQVIASLGYPPTHRTASLQEREWTYWYNRWITYKVVFNDAGKVAEVVGRPAPTAEKAIPPDSPPASPAGQKPEKKRHRKQ